MHTVPVADHEGCIRRRQDGVTFISVRMWGRHVERKQITCHCTQYSSGWMKSILNKGVVGLGITVSSEQWEWVEAWCVWQDSYSVCQKIEQTSCYALPFSFLQLAIISCYARWGSLNVLLKWPLCSASWAVWVAVHLYVQSVHLSPYPRARQVVMNFSVIYTPYKMYPVFFQPLVFPAYHMLIRQYMCKVRSSWNLFLNSYIVTWGHKVKNLTPYTRHDSLTLSLI